MKVLLLLACLAVAYANVPETHYKPGHEYEYVYEGQTLTGFPGSSKHYSGLKVKCMVKVYFQQSDKCQMKMEHCHLGKLNKQLSSTQIPERQVPHQEFENLDSDELQLIQQELEKPVEFVYEQGSVSQLEYDASEPEWSVDLKRAVLSMFQMNVNKPNIQYSEEPLSTNHILNREWRSQQQETLKVKEDSVSGQCEHLYTVNSLPIYGRYSVRQPIVPVLNVTKVKNFTTCQDYPILLNTSINMDNCTDCQPQKEQPIQSYSQTRCNCTGNKDHFLIESAETEERHIFTPYQERNGEVTTYVRKSLKLVDASPDRSHYPQMSGLLIRKIMVMKIVTLMDTSIL